jgi:protoporphyrin/coproporphyrin ferrochelatase
MTRQGLLLLNLGTPAAPTVPAVRRYLREFLSDPRVIDINPFLRTLLLYGLILPTRPRQSAKAYQSIWTERGSPLLVHGRDLAQKVSRSLGETWHVELAMRYQQPSIASALQQLGEHGASRIAVFPLFPQYASAAWGSAIERVLMLAGKGWNVPALQVAPPYYEHPEFVEALAAVTERALEGFEADRIIMSFHGLPERQLRRSDENKIKRCLQDPGCCDVIGPANQYCYRAQCMATSRALASRLRLAQGRWEITFQSRLGRIPWMRPYTDERIRELAGAGVKRLAVVCPSFTADCLETLEEIGIRAREDFEAHGGEELRLVPCLNSDDRWVRAIVQIAALTSASLTAGDAGHGREASTQ